MQNSYSLLYGLRDTHTVQLRDKAGIGLGNILVGYKWMLVTYSSAFFKGDEVSRDGSDSLPRFGVVISYSFLYSDSWSCVVIGLFLL